MLLISKQNELWSCASSQIAEDGKTIPNLSYFFKIDGDLHEIFCSEVVQFFSNQIFMRFWKAEIRIHASNFWKEWARELRNVSDCRAWKNDFKTFHNFLKSIVIYARYFAPNLFGFSLTRFLWDSEKQEICIHALNFWTKYARELRNVSDCRARKNNSKPLLIF